MLVHHTRLPPSPPSLWYPFTHLGEERQCGIKFLVKRIKEFETTQWERPGSNQRPSDQKSNALTTRPWHLTVEVRGYAYTGPFPNGSGPKIGSDRPSVYPAPFWNWSGTDPKLDLLFCRSNFGSVPDRFQSSPG